MVACVQMHEKGDEGEAIKGFSSEAVRLLRPSSPPREEGNQQNDMHSSKRADKQGACASDGRGKQND